MRLVKTNPIIFIQMGRYDKNENIQANKNRIIPVIRQLFDSDMVT